MTNKIEKDIMETVDNYMTNLNKDAFLSDVCPKLIGRWRAEETLAKNNKTIIDEFHDMRIEYVLELGDASEGRVVSALATTDVLTAFGVTHEEMHEAAMKNLQKEQFTLKPLGQVIKEITDSIFIEGLDESTKNNLDDVFPLVCSNKSDFFGATLLLKEGFIKSLAKSFGKDLYIIPSSVHELLILTEDALPCEIKELSQMVDDVNRTTVVKAEWLDDKAYRYSRERQALEPLYVG